ncbi:NAD(P)-binding domain-containing protein [Streptomyces sp. NBC_01549]|uniref:NADPH-dependent F420 reductase n=1 Tax=Streptomyces sp. NBC_01549 TaxID=2975874 RepID=UPI00225B9C34|nr:NAD(P)-binding domain-containing protein [Streptomyces sp. NBC_01549]MCX4588246.1 NAD(P)-binding domain-containing protein [Streptomyces sp. NBC_01549]
MRIGFIGAGRLTEIMSRHLLKAGHEVVISNSRGPETLTDFAAKLGPGAKPGTKADAVKSDIVILAVNWVDAEKALEGIEWDGQILIDATNAHAGYPVDISLEGVIKSRAVLAQTGQTSSELVADWAPGARLVKSISNVPMEWITDFSDDKPRTVLFASGDDVEAKRVVIDLLNGLGFAAIDLGSLATGGALHEVGAPLSGLEFHFVRRMRPEAR